MSDPKDFGDDFVPTDDAAATTVPPVEAKTVEKPVEAKAVEKPVDTTPELDPDALGDETPEEKAEREAAEAAERAAKNKRIPLERHEKILAKARQEADDLRAQLAAKDQGKAAAAADAVVSAARKRIGDLEDKYEELLSDGKRDEAKAVRMQLNAERTALQQQELETQTRTAASQAVAAVQWQAALDAAEAAHPEMNPDSPQHDPEIDAEVATLMKGFIATGTPKVAALAKALKYVFRDSPATPPPPTPKPKPTPAAPDTRDADARRKAAAALAAQPPIPTGPDQTTEPVRSTPATREAWEKMSEADKAKARGDEV